MMLLDPHTIASPATRVLDELRAQLGPGKTSDLARCTDRLAATLQHGQRRLADGIVLAMFGGGKDSVFMTALARGMQLSIAERDGDTFTLRIATNRHAGMPPAVMQNIDRAYRALDLYDDPRVELLSIDGNEVTRFDVLTPLPESIRMRDRLDILMNAHRCGADARPTFCNRCNLNMENALSLAVGHGHGRAADVVLTGDSPREQRHYLAWVRRTSQRLGRAPDTRKAGLRTFLTDLSGIEQHLSDDVYRGLDADAAERRLHIDDLRADPVFFSIYDDTTYRAGDHWALITQFLGFVFDDIAFSFTESDCGNPGLMAHLHALRHERLLGSRYDDGIREYASYALELMRRKQFPERLVATMVDRYASPEAIAIMRAKMHSYAREAFALSEEQLICMLFAPFAQNTANLRRYLAQEQPALLPSEDVIRALLAGQLDPAQAEALDDRLTALSGLDAAHRRALFNAPLIDTRRPGSVGVDPISLILKGDPHKAVIERRTPEGTVIREVISGR